MTVRIFAQRAVSALCVMALAGTTLLAVPSVAGAAGTFTQVSPTAESTTTVVTSTGFSGTSISFDTAVAPVVVAVSSSTNPGVVVDSSGAISTTGPLVAGSYSASGTATDSASSTGTWTYTLTVSAVTITQTSSTSNSTTPAASATYSISPLAVSNAVGTVTYSTSVTSPALTVGTNGSIATTGSLSAGAYTVSGTDADAYGDTGTWTYTLNVGAVALTQTSATSASTSPASSSTVSLPSLSVANATGAVSYATTVSNAGLSVASNGAISTTGTLSVGSYTVSGTDADTSSDTGTWTFTLTVSAVTLVQTSQTNAVATTTTVSTLSIPHIAVSGAVGPVTYLTTASSPGLIVTSGGAISTTGNLGFGSYTVSGTDGDAFGDAGTWTFSLSVVSVSLNQTSPTSGSTTSSASATFVIAPITVSNAIGSVNYLTTSPSPGLTVSAQGVITTTGTLAAGTYTVFGSDSDGFGEIGTWTYTLTVSGPVVAVTFDANGGSGTLATQSANVATPLSTNVFTRVGYTFAGWNTAADGSGTAYANGASYPFTAPATLYAQWAADPTHTVVYRANGGVGSMPDQHDFAPTRLNTNLFSRPGYTFAGWNTAADGSGTSYPNGATYPFTGSTTLYAQWSGAANHSVTFNPNGGTGVMSRQLHHGPANLARNVFTRPGYVFTGWNTAANGSGATYANGASYSFVTSTTLFAQWKVKAKAKLTVTFNANGGTGVVGPQTSARPAPLTPNGFTRPGYVFTGWNTAANGSGAPYANGASYAFVSSTTLFAQWRVVKKPVKPAIHAVATLSSFSVNSYELSSSLQSQVADLAKLIKTNRDTQIVLVGYGDTLTKADQLNELKWAAELKLSKQRAIAVEAYLTLQLHTLGVNGFSISVLGQGATSPGASSAADAKNRRVVATLS